MKGNKVDTSKVSKMIIAYCNRVKSNKISSSSSHGSIGILKTK